MTYDELLTAVTEAEMIINSRPLSYVSTEDIEEPLTPSHLLVGHRVLSLPDPSRTCGEDSIDVSQETLSKRAKHLGKIMEQFWKWWRAEYLLLLRKYHCYSWASGQHLTQSDIVLVHNHKHLRGFWKLARIERLLEGLGQANQRCCHWDPVKIFKYHFEATTELSLSIRDYMPSSEQG